MAVRVGINGFGRIGRLVFRAMAARPDDFEIAAINDLSDAKSLKQLVKYDTVHGRFNGTVEAGDAELIVNGRTIKVLAERAPAKLPWKELGVTVALESTGVFTKRSGERGGYGDHLAAGAKKVVISAPTKDDPDLMMVFGVNDADLNASHLCVSNASCTTNCLAPLVKPLHDTIGVVAGIMTTIHAYTNDQVLTDVYHSDLRRARSATQSMIPTTTGAAAAVGLVLPELNGRLDGFSVRVPTINVSLVDLTFEAARETSVDEINQVMREAASGELKGILDYNDKPLVSIDFNHSPASSTYDSAMTRVVNGKTVKVCSWYDNEWGFSNRMLDTCVALMNAT